MAKYRKKPIVIEAEIWNGKFPNGLGVEFWTFDDDAGGCKECGVLLSLHGKVITLEGYHIACPGDWIITGVKGEKYPCKPDVFELTYEKVEEEK